MSKMEEILFFVGIIIICLAAWLLFKFWLNDGTSDVYYLKVPTKPCGWIKNPAIVNLLNQVYNDIKDEVKNGQWTGEDDWECRLAELMRDDWQSEMELP